MSSETSAVNVHGCMEREAAYTFGDDAGSYQCVFVYRDSASVFGCKDHSADDDCQPDRSADCTTGYHLVMASWLLLGLCGVPVFSGGSAGPGKLLGPSGGYYIGFLVVAFLISLFCRKWKNVAFQTAFLIVVGIPVIYAFGAGWMKHVTGQPWGAVIVQSIIPFIPLDIVKCVAAVALGKALKRTGLFGN